MTAPVTLRPGVLEAAKRLADYAVTMAEERAVAEQQAAEWEAARVVKQQGFWARRDAANDGRV